MSRFILRQIARNQSAKDIVVDRHARIQAEGGATFQLLDARSMKPASGVVLKRKGDALVVEADGEIAVEVERFYGSQAGAVFEASGGGGQVQVVTEATMLPEPSPSAAQSGSSAGAAAGEDGEPLLGAFVLVGLGLLSSSGSSAATPVDNTVVAKVVAGPVVKDNDLIATIYAADGTTVLGQGAINEDGTVTVKVGSYTGVVIVKVQNDQNPANDRADYMDEATGVAKDLGDAVLSSMGEIVTLNGVITLNVNILTALAYHEAAEAAKGAPLTAPLVRDTNAAVARAFGLESLTEGDIKTIVDQGGNASPSNKYGDLLAALSGADKNNGGSVKATLDALINAVSVTGATATLTAAVTTLLSEGAKIVDPDNSKGLLSTVQSALQSSGTTTPPSTPETTDATPPVASVTTATIASTGRAVVQSNEPGIAYLVRDTVVVTNLASITSAADEVWNSEAIAADTATSLPATGLGAGTYKVYAADTAGNLSTASSNSITIYPTIELSAIAAGAGGFVITGQATFDESGASVASAGDVNGDGLDDLIVGASSADPAGRTDAGKSYLVFGKTGVVAVDLSAIDAGSGGFVINGNKGGSAQDKSGWSVASAGDVNGDGLADLIVGARMASVGWENAAGRSYVVFGKTDVAPVELSGIEAGSGGFVINGQSFFNQSGWSVASAGDVNGDGLADLIVGAKNASPTGRASAGKSYVVFGKTSGTAIDLSAIETGNGGFVINGQAGDDNSGYSVASAGDVNGDGLADLIVGASSADTAGGTDAGRSYVVFGKTSGTAIDLSAIEAGNGGFVINGQAAGDQSGISVASAGDVNGDGLADLIVGASSADTAGGTDAGRSYVVFGKTSGTAIDLLAVATGSGGFVINGQAGGDNSGNSVASAGDVNGDGLADLIVGALRASPVFMDWAFGRVERSAGQAGKSYVVFGKTDVSAVELSAVEAAIGGFVINGRTVGDQSGESVASAGDVNGDGLADLIVGARAADPAGLQLAGESYVIFGSTSGAFIETAVDEVGTTGDDALWDGGAAKTLVGGAGDDSLSATAASVLYGGSGNDSFQINAAMIAALRSPMGSGGNDNQLARINGGSGIDTIVLSGGSLALDLTQIANQSASNTNGSSRIQSIEAIDLTGTGDNTLKLKVNDLFDMTGFNNFAATGRRQLLVKGDTGDTVDLDDGSGTTGWTQSGTEVIDSVTYNAWSHDASLATLYVAPSIGVI